MSEPDYFGGSSFSKKDSAFTLGTKCPGSTDSLAPGVPTAAPVNKTYFTWMPGPFFKIVPDVYGNVEDQALVFDVIVPPRMYLCLKLGQLNKSEDALCFYNDPNDKVGVVD